MSWIQKLYETYENCQLMVGIINGEKQVPLLPICHNTQQAQIEIVIDHNGDFKRARVVSKDDATTVIPCTESSGGRAGKKPVNHPLCDKLQYIAGDFIDYGGVVTTGYAKNPKEPYESYCDALKKWCESEFSNPKVKAILKYVEKGSVIKDLVENQVLFLGTNDKLLEKWDKKIFKHAPNSSQNDAFVRWIVEIPNDPQTSVWTDLGLYESWTKYYSSLKNDQALCYVTGNIAPMADQHPSKIRNDGDKAKLISSNDHSGFTYRGRFRTAEQACGVSFEVTQKAHKVLRWLIDRQGYRRGSQVIVAWATSGEQIPDPLADPFSLLGFDTEQIPSESTEEAVTTAQNLAIKLKRKISGYSMILDNTAEVVVMGLDSATEGRMAITFYRNLTGSDFLARIEHWHNTCCWAHNYRLKEIVDARTKKKRKIPIKFVGAPAPNDIAEAAYGSRVDDKLRRTTVERILPCIIDGQKVPRDLVESTARRASNRVGMKDYEWNKTLSIACALYKKYHEKEDLDMALDLNRRTRDYLYGRLLALADGMEQWALKKAGENRQTTAARMMQRFSDHPFSTWRTIELSLGPYKARLGGASIYLHNMISEVMAMFNPEEFISDKSLSGEFLLGYHCQREALWDRGNQAK